MTDERDLARAPIAPASDEVDVGQVATLSITDVTAAFRRRQKELRAREPRIPKSVAERAAWAKAELATGLAQERHEADRKDANTNGEMWINKATDRRRSREYRAREKQKRMAEHDARVAALDLDEIACAMDLARLDAWLSIDGPRQRQLRRSRDELRFDRAALFMARATHPEGVSPAKFKRFIDQTGTMTTQQAKDRLTRIVRLEGQH